MRALRTLLALSVGLAASLALAAPAVAADVPVIGVATGDATRGPLVDHIQAMNGMTIDSPGFVLIPPSQAAVKIEERAKAGTPPPEFDRDGHRKSLVDYERAVEADEWTGARNAMIGALRRIEVGDTGRRIQLGLQAEWAHVRVLLAQAWILDRPPAKRKRQAEPDETHLGYAREAIRPIFELLPDWQPVEAYDAETVALIDEVKRELRRTGTLTVTSPAGNAPVFVNGVEVGRTPLDGYRLAIGTYDVQAGKPERISRLHSLDIEAGADSEVRIDPLFEHDVTTQGYAIVEAPPGQSASPSAVQLGSGAATLLDTRYALVFAVEGANPLLLYAAMVDRENGVVVRERTVEVEPGPVQTDVLKRLLLYVVDGTEIDTSWPVGRYIWISGFVVGTGLLATATYFLITAEGNIADGDSRDQFTSDVQRLEDDASTNRTIGWALSGVGGVVMGLSIYFLVADLSSESDASAAAPGDWRLLAAPAPDGASVGFSIVF